MRGESEGRRKEGGDKETGKREEKKEGTWEFRTLGRGRKGKERTECVEGERARNESRSRGGGGRCVKKREENESQEDVGRRKSHLVKK